MYGKAEYEPSAAERSAAAERPAAAERSAAAERTAAESPSERTAAEQILIRERGNREKRLSHSFFSARFRLLCTVQGALRKAAFSVLGRKGSFFSLPADEKTKNFQKTWKNS